MWVSVTTDSFKKFEGFTMSSLTVKLLATGCVALFLAACQPENESEKSVAITEVETPQTQTVSVETQTETSTTVSTLATLKELEALLSANGWPQADRMIDINKSVPKLLATAGLTGVKPNSGGVFLYRSNGESYKLIALGTGDCGDVFAMSPELVDEKASRRNLGTDCEAYGYWGGPEATRY
jgi:hypothetical protein